VTLSLSISRTAADGGKAANYALGSKAAHVTSADITAAGP
jgi:hypothetical protein